MEDHSLEIQLFFFGSAVLTALEAMKERHWRAYALWGVTALGVICGTGWGTIKEWSPPVTAFITQIATNPESWFILIVLGLVWLVVSGRNTMPKVEARNATELSSEAQQTDWAKLIKGFGSRIDDLEDNVFSILQRQQEHISTPELRQDLEKDITTLSARIAVVVSEIYTKSDEQYSTIDKRISALDERLQFPPNLGDTLGEALRSIEDVRLGQIARIRDEANAIISKTAIWDREIDILLSWALARVARMTFAQLALQVPELDEVAPSADQVERQSAINKAMQYVGRVRSATNDLAISFDLSAVVEQAAQHAEQVLRNIIPPHNMHALDFKDYYVAVHKAKRVAQFLEERVQIGDYEEGGNYLSILLELRKGREAKRR